jgi:hypothetical protein
MLLSSAHRKGAGFFMHPCNLPSAPTGAMLIGPSFAERKNRPRRSKPVRVGSTGTRARLSSAFAVLGQPLWYENVLQNQEVWPSATFPSSSPTCPATQSGPWEQKYASDGAPPGAEADTTRLPALAEELARRVFALRIEFGASIACRVELRAGFAGRPAPGLRRLRGWAERTRTRKREPACASSRGMPLGSAIPAYG